MTSTKKIILSLGIDEANKMRRQMQHLQNAKQLEQFISNAPFVYRNDLLELVDREMSAAQKNWDRWREDHKIDRDLTFSVDFDRGELFVMEEEPTDGGDSQSGDEPSPEPAA